MNRKSRLSRWHDSFARGRSAPRLRGHHDPIRSHASARAAPPRSSRVPSTGRCGRRARRAGSSGIATPCPPRACCWSRTGACCSCGASTSRARAQWCLPAGFMEAGETPEQTAVRELREETGLEARLTGLFHVYAGFDDPRVRAVLILYTAERTGGALVPGRRRDRGGVVPARPRRRRTSRSPRTARRSPRGSRGPELDELTATCAGARVVRRNGTRVRALQAVRFPRRTLKTAGAPIPRKLTAARPSPVFVPPEPRRDPVPHRELHGPCSAARPLPRIALAFAGLALLALALRSPGASVTAIAASLVLLGASAILAHHASVRDRAGRDAETRELRAGLEQANAAVMKAHVDLEVLSGELNEATRHFELALQGSNDGVWEYDLRTEQLYLSPDFRERLGIEPEEQSHGSARVVRDARAPRRPAGAGAAPSSEHLEQRASYSLDLRLRTPDGRVPLVPRARLGGVESRGPARPHVGLAHGHHRAALRRGARARERGELPLAERRLAGGHPQDRRARASASTATGAGRRSPGLRDFEALGDGWVDAVAAEDRDEVIARWAEYVARAAERSTSRFRVRAAGRHDALGALARQPDDRRAGRRVGLRAHVRGRDRRAPRPRSRSPRRATRPCRPRRRRASSSPT